MTDPQSSARVAADLGTVRLALELLERTAGRRRRCRRCRNVIAENARKRGQAWSVPCALAALLLAPPIVGVLFWISTLAAPFTFDPESFLDRLFFEAVSNGAGGAAFVFVGARIAPDRRLHAAYALAALSVLISGIILYLAAEMGDLWAIWEIAWTGIGSLAVVFWIRKGDIYLTYARGE